MLGRLPERLIRIQDRGGTGKLLTVENRQILQERLPEAIIATYTPDQLMEGRDESGR